MRVTLCVPTLRYLISNDVGACVYFFSEESYLFGRAGDEGLVKMKHNLARILRFLLLRLAGKS